MIVKVLDVTKFKNTFKQKIDVLCDFSKEQNSKVICFFPYMRMAVSNSPTLACTRPMFSSARDFDSSSSLATAHGQQ